MTAETINTLANRVHTANAKWWMHLDTGLPIERNIGELLMLTVSEFAEAMEGHRKNLMDDKLPHRKMFEVEMADVFIRVLDIVGGFHCFELFDITDNKIERIFAQMSTAPGVNIGEQLLHGVDHCIQAYNDRFAPRMFFIDLLALLAWIHDYSNASGIDLMGAFEEKMAYNAVRADHTYEARLAEGGKKY